MTTQLISAPVAPRSILWKRLDVPGHEAARLEHAHGRWDLAGASIFTHDGRVCRLYYDIVCADDWRTVRARVAGWVGEQSVEVSIEVDRAGRWRLNGAECPQVEGCIDVDLNFSPSTNLLPIRRLALDVGQEAEVRAAWLRFPSFALEPLPQRYRRTAEHAYRYESAGGAFVRDLAVDDAGFVTRYPDFFEAEVDGRTLDPQ
ncbi:MAG TPA: putative glycolipid-binding domain-containing protein [Longimicrobiaceae bacterium]